MNIFSFSAHFTSEEDCRNHFKCERDKIGVIEDTLVRRFSTGWLLLILRGK